MNQTSKTTKSIKSGDMTISPLRPVLCCVFLTKGGFDPKVSPNFLCFFSVQCKRVSVLPHFCFSEHFFQTPAHVKKVEIFKINTFAFALVVVNRTNVAKHLLYLSYPLTRWLLHGTWRHHLSSIGVIFTIISLGFLWLPSHFAHQMLLLFAHFLLFTFLFWLSHPACTFRGQHYDNFKVIMMPSLPFFTTQWCAATVLTPLHDFTFYSAPMTWIINNNYSLKWCMQLSKAMISRYELTVVPMCC